MRLGKFEISFGNRKGGSPEQRSSFGLTDYQGWLSYFGLGGNSSEELVTEFTAMRVATVTTCLKVLGESIASLPLSVMRKDGDSRSVATDHPANFLLSTRANRYMNAYNWVFAMITMAAGWGEAYGFIQKDQYGDPLSITLLPSWKVTRIWMPTGELYYKCLDGVYNPDDVIVLRPFSLDGVNPVSIIRYNSETFGFAQKQNKYRGKVFNERPPGYLTSPNPIQSTQLKDIGEQWKNQVNGSTPAVMYNGLEYRPISFSPADLQLLESTAATKEDICGMFRMPPTLIQNYARATFANAEQQDLVFTKYTLLPIIKNFEQEMDAKLFNEINHKSASPLYTNFNLNGLLRADFKTRTEGYRTLQSIGVLSSNDIRKMEDLNPIDGGNAYYVPMNVISTDKAPEFYDKLIGVGMNAGVQKNGADMSTEQRSFLEKVSALVRMNGYNHEEHA